MLTIVIPYYENPKMLRLQLQEWQAYRLSEKQALCALIVDDASPRSPAAEVVKLYGESVGMPIRVLRINENKPWNQDGARNLAMKNVLTNWAMMTDMDHMIARHDVSAFLDFTSHVAKRGAYYMPQRVEFDMRPVHPHANSYLFNVQDFWSMGGYDEDFAGCYGSDGNFRKCARAVLQEITITNCRLTRWSSDAISDANTREWGRKDSPYHRSNFPKLEAKAKGPAYKAEAPIRFTWQQEY